MSGNNVTYSLRPNKFVERHLFVDLLAILCNGFPVERFAYVSMGGPQLEDHRLIHQRLGLKCLISLESDETVYKRQLFNLRPSYIDCQCMAVTDFVNDFDIFQEKYSEQEKIIWFDYASPRERRNQIIEYETVLSKLEDGDIFKITMNANPTTLGERRKDETPEEVQAIRRDALLLQLDGLVPSVLDSNKVTKNGLPIILAEAIRLASIRALQTRHKFTAIPLGLFTYQDGPHQMLTITVRVTKNAEVDSIRDRLINGGWKEYLPPKNSWQEITGISVPNLSAKERLHLEQILFGEAHEIIHMQLPFRLDSHEKTSLTMLEEYARHYRRYPSYFQVIL